MSGSSLNNMAIGLLAIGFALVFGLVSFMGTSDRPERRDIDYSKIYKSVQVKEL